MTLRTPTSHQNKYKGKNINATLYLCVNIFYEFIAFKMSESFFVLPPANTQLCYKMTRLINKWSILFPVFKKSSEKPKQEKSRSKKPTQNIGQTEMLD